VAGFDPAIHRDRWEGAGRKARPFFVLALNAAFLRPVSDFALNAREIVYMRECCRGYLATVIDRTRRFGAKLLLQSHFG